MVRLDVVCHCAKVCSTGWQGKGPSHLAVVFWIGAFVHRDTPWYVERIKQGEGYAKDMG